jgi:hypothetical protein
MEFFTATGKLKKFFFKQLEMFDVCTTGDTAHVDTIFKFLPHTPKLFQFSCGCEKFHYGRSFGFLVTHVCNYGEHYETPCICIICNMLT